MKDTVSSQTALVNFFPLDRFVLRTPLLSVDALSPLRSAGAELPIGADESRRIALLEAARAILSSSPVKEAIYIASPTTYDELCRWEHGARPDPRLVQTLFRYVQRLCTRPTPFGLFAGYSVGTVSGSRTALDVGGADRCARITRLDCQFLSQLYSHLASQEAVREQLELWNNSSLRFVHGKWRYVKTVIGRAGVEHELIALDSDDCLELVFDLARNGIFFNALVNSICRHDSEIPLPEATRFVSELLTTQALTSRLAVPVTGVEPLTDIVGLLAEVNLRPAYNALAEVRRRLQELDALPIGVGPEAYAQISDVLTDQFPVPVERSRLFHVDMIRSPAHAVLGADVLANLAYGIDVLHKVIGRESDGELESFASRFEERYGTSRVPLVEALDDEIGIGFGESVSPVTQDHAPLLEGLGLARRAAAPAGSWSRQHTILLEMVTRATDRTGLVLDLTPEDIERLAASHPPPRPLPASFSANVALAKTPTGDYTAFLRFVQGPPGAALLGRFCHGDAELGQIVRSALELEEQFEPDAVFAEVVHLPSGRVGNVITRPVLREYEIPYLGRSGAPPEKQLRLQELSVYVDRGQIVLWSEALRKRVVPRLTNAHNYAAGDSTYRFLCSLQRQNVSASLAWRWGPLEAAAFLPRVVAKGVVLSRARWRLNSVQIKRLSALDIEGAYQEMRRWAEISSTPDTLVIADGDNEMLVDLRSRASIDCFVQLVKGRESIVLHEMCPPPEFLAVEGTGGRYAHEIVLPFQRTRDSDTSVRVRHPGSGHLARRSFPPGSDWGFIKCYVGSGNLDHLLVNVIEPAMRELAGSGLVDEWFFVRYGDPEWHLRLRFRAGCAGGASLAAGEVLSLISPLARERFLWKVELSTYEREIERYGGATGVELSESLFAVDSVAASALIRATASASRWKACVLSWHMLLCDLGFGLEDRRAIVQWRRDSLASEYSMSKRHRRALGDRFRRERSGIERLIFSPTPTDDCPQSVLDALQVRSTALARIAERLREAISAGSVDVSLDTLAQSYLHMNVNRLLRSAHRTYELVISDFLVRTYESQVARQSTESGRRRKL